MYCISHLSPAKYSHHRGLTSCSLDSGRRWRPVLTQRRAWRPGCSCCSHLAMPLRSRGRMCAPESKWFPLSTRLLSLTFLHALPVQLGSWLRGGKEDVAAVPLPTGDLEPAKANRVRTYTPRIGLSNPCCPKHVQCTHLTNELKCHSTCTGPDRRIASRLLRHDLRGRGPADPHRRRKLQQLLHPASAGRG